MWFRSQQQSEQRIAALVVASLAPELGRMQSALNVVVATLAPQLGRIEVSINNLTNEGASLMSQITDWAAKEQADLTSISTTLDGIVSGIGVLNTLITNLQNSPGTLSASDQAALDQIQAASDALVTKANAISVAPPVSSTPPATGTTA